jgi:pyruvate/2-oxoglutarate dehydrogenase complex dihydrolipoamide acyltransferase (E2) component
MGSPQPNGTYRVIVPSMSRQLAMDAFAALPDTHPMVGLLELDVTEALAAIEALRHQGERVSLFAFVIRAIAVAISEHPDLNLVRHGRRLVAFDDVDVSVPIEVDTPDGHVPRQIVVRRAQDRTAQEIYGQLDAARTRHRESGTTSDEDRWAHRLQRALGWMPRFLRIAMVRQVMKNGFRIKARAGTTLVTSVGKFAAIPGFSLTFSTGPRAATFVVGGVVPRPWVHGGQLTVRSVLSLTVIVDHDLVDGAPAARFAERLQSLIESADGLVAPAPRPSRRSDGHAPSTAPR